jgi:hypothetical protein
MRGLSSCISHGQSLTDTNIAFELAVRTKKFIIDIFARLSRALHLPQFQVTQIALEK